MRTICAWVVAALLVSPLVGCGDQGELTEGIPKDAAGKATATSAPGMDLMKEKMEKKGARK